MSLGGRSELTDHVGLERRASMSMGSVLELALEVRCAYEVESARRKALDDVVDVIAPRKALVPKGNGMIAI